jgi:uncharacterized membrane protein YdbT with pleckstrin-like domain
VAIDRRRLTDDERVVVSSRAHPKVLVRPALLVGGGFGLAAFVSRLPVGEVVHAGAWLLAAVGLVWYLVVPVLRWWTTTYTFTDQRFVKRSGLLSRHGRTIPLDRIDGVDYAVGLVDRLLGSGTLIVTDATQGGRVLIHDMPRVEEVHLMVAEELAGLGDADRSDDGR